MTANHHENNGADRQRVEELAVLATTRGLDQLTAEEDAILASAMTLPANMELQGASEHASRVAAAVAAAITSNELPSPSAELRAAIEAELDATLVSPAKARNSEFAVRTRRVNGYQLGAVLFVIGGVIACLLLPPVQMARKTAQGLPPIALGPPQDGTAADAKSQSFGEHHYSASGPTSAPEPQADPARTDPALARPTVTDLSSTTHNPSPMYSDEFRMKQSGGSIRPIGGKPSVVPLDAKPSNRTAVVNNFTEEATVARKALPSEGYLSDDVQYFEPSDRRFSSAIKERSLESLAKREHARGLGDVSGESYAAIRENAFRLVRDEPLSTFSIDVDTASYANVRRFLMAGQLPPKDAVRIEELLNYFSYDYPQPQEKDPFSVNMELTDCPWRPENRLLRVGLKGREVAKQQRAASNLVFLVDVSGSMQAENKLPLVKTALKMLVQELTENDRVSIVTYAGDAGLKLPSTNGTEQSRILSTIDSLSAGGSTHGSAGIELAYEQASGYFIRGGTNRVILLTDGDLNVGITDDNALVQLIQQKAKSGVFLTVLGVGDGNLKDSKMEKLADHWNGVYAYLDGVREARKVLVEQLSGSLITIAKDVKFQIEFNPAQVQAYRLVGYENRVLASRDFHDDTKDAGEIGAGHTVTALYELVPTNVPVPVPGEPLKYQPQRVEETPAAPVAQASRELLTLKLRFKQPEADRSELRDYPLTDRGGKFGQASTDFRFASSVAMFGLVLRDSQYRGSATLAAVEEIATSSLGEDPRGYRSEFVDLVRKAEQLK